MVDFLSDFVSASLQVLIEKIVNLGILVYQSLSDVDNKLKKLQRTLFRVQALLHDSEEKQRNDKAWQVALQDLEQLAYDADDLLDEIAIQVSNVDGDNNKDQIYKLMLSLFKTTSAPNLNTIQGRLDGILKEIDSLCLREIVQGRQLNASNRQSTSLSDGSPMFGREEDMAKIMNNVLLSEGNDLCIIPITGMVAVGKTTLAQAVYNKSYEDMRSPFQLKMWVTVTKLFDVTQLTRSIIEAASGVTVTLSDLDPLQIQLSHMLREKKFLLVLDDVWNEVQHEWDLLLKPLRHGSKGSKIIVTTRTQLVCSLVGTVEACTLEPLLDEHCWLLVREKALGNTVLPGSVPKLEAIGRNIARKCTGLPLAAKCVGSLMHSKVNEDEWNAILETKLWDLPKVQNEVFPALKSSYQDLAAHLKQCFAYCSMFPRIHDLDKERIVQMWMAEGLIQAQGRRRVDDIGSDYFEQLFQMFFIQKNKDNAKYSMHDAVRNLAESVSGDKFFIREEESDDFQTSHVHSNTRHFALLWGGIETDMLESFSNCKGLRSFLVSGKTRTSVNNLCFLDLFHKLKRLRVLDLSHSQITDLAVSIGSLKHLRFLDLSKTRVALLPSTTSKLCSLQTLRLKNCSNLLLLPKRMKKLNSLQHLLIGGNIKLASMPSGIGELKRLQTLDEFIVGESGQIRELEGLNMLRGTLCIKQLQKVTDPQHAMDASLSSKRYLNKLELQWRSSSSSSSANLQTQQETVLKNLEPHKNLNELTLRCYGGGAFPRWVSSPLYLKLTSISLHECQNCDSLPCLGEHPKLKSLKIVGMQNMKQWDCKLFRTNNRDAAAFQSLEILELRDMPALQDWSGVLNNDMACLRQLTISECPELIMMPSIHNFGSIETLEFCNCDRLDSFANESLSSSVVSLSIMYCPILKARYINDGGVDWIKIKHIPFIRIDDQKFGNQ